MRALLCRIIFKQPFRVSINNYHWHNNSWGGCGGDKVINHRKKATVY